jgi:hypothetical protein
MRVLTMGVQSILGAADATLCLFVFHCRLDVFVVPVRTLVVAEDDWFAWRFQVVVETCRYAYTVWMVVCSYQGFDE